MLSGTMIVNATTSNNNNESWL